MGSLFHEILYRPLLNALVAVYNMLPVSDLGLAIVLLTVLLRFILLPLSLKATRSQRALQKLAPEMEELKKRHKGDQAAQSAALMQLYKERGINPLSGCLPLLIQLPILFALYRVFLTGLNGENLTELYSFIATPEFIGTQFLGLLDITIRQPILAILAGVLQFGFGKLTTAGKTGGEMVAMTNAQVLYFFPILIIIITWNLPAGLALYFVTTTIVSILEHVYVRKT